MCTLPKLITIWCQCLTSTVDASFLCTHRASRACKYPHKKTVYWDRYIQHSRRYVETWSAWLPLQQLASGTYNQASSRFLLSFSGAANWIRCWNSRVVSSRPTLWIERLLQNLRKFVYPILPVSFGWDTISRWSFLSGVYARGSKRSHTERICITCHGLPNSKRHKILK